MKRYLSLALLFGCAQIIQAVSQTDNCDTEFTSKSYLGTMPYFQSGTPEYLTAFRSNRTGMKVDGYDGAIQLALFGGNSTSGEDLARYFLPFGKTTVTFGESFLANDVDILASNFGIVTTNAVNDTGEVFKSKVSLDPKQSVFGVGLHYRQGFCRDEEKCRGWYFAASTPLMHVRNNMRISENVIEDGGGVFETGDETLPTYANALDAFEQSGWNYGKISRKSLKKTRLADIEAKIGYEWLECDPCRVDSYFGIVIPTGNKVKSEYLFEPIVGNGRHFGLIWGGNAAINIWKSNCEDFSLLMEISNNSRYLFKKEQVRSIDLKHKEWSRYLRLYENQEQAQAVAALEDNVALNLTSTPGINILTRSVDVTPGFAHQTNTAFILSYKKCELEAGYNLFVKRSECVELAKAWQEGPAIRHQGGAGLVNPILDITANPFLINATVNDPENVPGFVLPVPVENYENHVIKTDDLDLASAAAPCMLAHTVYASATHDMEYCDWPLFANIGGSYTFSQSNNSVIKHWTLWAKMGLSF